MSINKYKVFLKCPHCGKVVFSDDYHENTSSDNSEFFEVLNIGKQSNHMWLGNPHQPSGFVCGACGEQTPYSEIFTKGNAWVEDLTVYKRVLKYSIRFADRKGKVSFSDWDENWDEQPALSRLIQMYPEDDDLRRLQKIYRLLHMLGKSAVTKFEANTSTVSRNQIPFPEVLSSVYLGNEVQRIAPHTFEDCDISDIYIPDSVVEIGEYAFAGSGLYRIRTGSGIEVMGKRAFANTNIFQFFLPTHMKEIGEECFSNCKNLKSMWIPPQMTVGSNAFSGCNSLKRIQVANDIPQSELLTWGIPDSCVIEMYDS